MGKGGHNFIDLTGQKFGRLTVVGRADNNKNGQARWWCVCDCGSKDENGNPLLVRVVSSDLKRKDNRATTSCGCYKNERQIEANTKHGLYGTHFYKTWFSMKQRCYDSSMDDYEFYGGKGITVCDDWHDFINFKNDMYESYLEHREKYGEKNTTIDRIDSAKNYYLENCRWATWKVQHLNMKQYKNNTSGCEGAYWKEKLQKYEVRLYVDGKTIALGCYSDIEECKRVRKAAEEKYYAPILEQVTYPKIHKSIDN